MPSPDLPPPATVSGRERLLRHPLIRLVVALLWIVIPFVLASLPFNHYVSDPLIKKAGALLLAAIVLGAYWSYVRVVEKRAVTELSGSGATRELLAGMLLGALLLSATMGVLAILGVYRVTGIQGWVPMVATLPGFILAAVFEEVLLRAIVFRLLEQWLGSWIALALSAALFGILHIFNPGATLLDACAIMLEAGILLAAAYMLTRRLWLVFGIHLAWNFMQGGVFSAAVSGGTTTGLLQAKLQGPAWLSGGAFGAEASVVALVVCVVAGLLLLRAAWRKGHVLAPGRGPNAN